MLVHLLSALPLLSGNATRAGTAKARKGILVLLCRQSTSITCVCMCVQGATAQHIACQLGSPGIVQALLEHGAPLAFDVDSPCKVIVTAWYTSHQSMLGVQCISTWMTTWAGVVLLAQAISQCALCTDAFAHILYNIRVKHMMYAQLRHRSTVATVFLLHQSGCPCNLLALASYVSTCC